MKKSDIIREQILSAIKNCPNSNPSGELQKRFKITREALRAHFNALISKGLLTSDGYGKGRVYAPGPNFVVAESIHEFQVPYKKLAESGEDEIFQECVHPAFASGLSPSLYSRIQYVTTECLNNVIDHSSASNVKITVMISAEEINLIFDDDGKGVFASLQEYFSLKDLFEAAGELAKGKRTTAPQAHAGEGLFFSARIADFFILEANGVRFTYFESQDDWSIGKALGVQKGSKLHFKFTINSDKTTKSVFDRYTKNYSFQIKSPRIVEAYVIALPSGHIVSRSEAKKILAGAEDFESIVLDFKNVESIGQGFADEVFRVFCNQYPKISIESKNANSFILSMIAYVRDKKRN